jgi:Kef-type K+ transport system membrane component KefB
VSLGEVTWIIAKAVLFLGGSIWLGRAIAPHSSRWLARIDASQTMLFAQVLSTGLAFAWLAHAIGLAPIIGAFAAGLLFEPVFLRHYERPSIVEEIKSLVAGNADASHKVQPVLERHGHRQHEHMLEPIGYFFVPVFFVLTGMQVNLITLADPYTVALALGLAAAAIVGKLVAGVFARDAGAWIVGWGMVPRGEVGLIFAATGKQLGVISESLFSVLVVMVILTTLVTPPVLTWLLKRRPVVEAG